MSTPIKLEDFVDCGKVYEQFRKSPDSSIDQIAKLTRLPRTRVKDLAEYLQKENLIHKLHEEKSEPLDVGRERIIEIFAPPEANSRSLGINVTDKNADLIETRDKELKDNQITCLSCQHPLPQTYYDDHDGLCPSCYYKALLIDAAKQERRSGIYGSDRAGTW